MKKMKNDPTIYIIFFSSVATGLAPPRSCADDATRPPAICARAPLLHRRDWLVSGDLGGLEGLRETKLHDHATRGHVARVILHQFFILGA